jgi:lipoprotein-releasing system permease protein
LNWLFAWRYFRSKKSANAINIIAWISVLAIAVGTAALIIVLSVFNGFEDLVKGLYSDFYSDIKISPATGKFIDFTPDVLQKIKTIPGVANYSAYIEEKAVLVNGDYQTIAVMKGVDEQYITVNGLIKHIERGEYNLGTTNAPAIIAGTGISNAVGADPENTLANLIIYPTVKPPTLAAWMPCTPTIFKQQVYLPCSRSLTISMLLPIWPLCSTCSTLLHSNIVV